MSSVARAAAARLNWRHALVLIHRYGGLFIALFLIIAGLTGTVVAFTRELDPWLNPELFQVPERPGPVMDNEALVRHLGALYPHAYVSMIRLDLKPGQSMKVRLNARIDPATGRLHRLEANEIFLDPYDGRVLGGRTRGAFAADRAHLLGFLLKVHYSLYLPERWGDWLFGIAALVWTFDCFVGFYLTLPARAGAAARKSWWQRWRPAWRIKRGASATRLNFDLHRAGGLWCWVLLFILAFTSVALNLTNEVFRPLVGLFGEQAPTPSQRLTALPRLHTPPQVDVASAAELGRQSLGAASQGMEPLFVGLVTDTPPVYRVRFAGPGRGERNGGFRYETLYIDATSGALLWRDGHNQGSAADRFGFWQYSLHSGEVFGFWGRVLAAVMGLAVTLLSVTGVVIWLKKQRGRHRARHTADVT